MVFISAVTYFIVSARRRPGREVITRGLETDSSVEAARAGEKGPG